MRLAHSRFNMVLGVYILLPSALLAQAYTGSISGIVTDSTGAVVPGVAITVTEVNKNVNSRAETNVTGFYAVSSLEAGTYRLSAAKAGFRTFMLDALPLATQQRATVNIELQVGGVTERVEVLAQPQMIESSTSTLSAVVENKRIVDLPLNGRNIFTLTALVPGVFFSKPLSGPGDGFDDASMFMVNGGAMSGAAILLDGVSAYAPHNVIDHEAVAAIPSVDGIQEFRIQTNAFSAEYGRSGGGVVTMVTKSGTNQLHGTLFEFLRNSVMDCNSFFANKVGTALTSFKRNQFGASLGGPVRLPRVYNGRDRAFFFFDYEGTRKTTPFFQQFSVPTEGERQGDFSDTFISAAGPLRVIYDPFSTRPNPALPGKYLRDPFAGNIIPRNRVDPVAADINKYFPAPNRPGAAGTHLNNYAAQVPNPGPMDRYDLKMDYNLRDGQRLSGRYSLSNSEYGSPDLWSNIAATGYMMHQRLQHSALDYTATLNSSTVLDLRYGFVRAAADRYPTATNVSLSELGFPKALDEIVGLHVFPYIAGAYTTLGPNWSIIYEMADYQHTLSGSLAKVAGRHSMKLGVESILNYVNFYQPLYVSGGYQFDAGMTQGPDPRVASSSAGLGYASFLLGAGSSGQIGHAMRPSNFNRYFAWYVQDDFKVNRRLTLNFGFRWDFETGVTERHDRLSAFDPTIRNPISDQVGMDLRGVYLFAAGSLGRRGIRDTSLRELGPRFGFAYELNSETVVRSGYGVFFGRPIWSANSKYTGDAFISNTPWSTSLDGITPYNLLSNPFAQGFNLPQGSSRGALTLVGMQSEGAWPQSLRPLYNQQWNFTLQRSFGTGLLWEIAYAGNKGTNLAVEAYDNQLNPALLSLGDKLLEMVPNPFFGIINVPGVLGQPTVQRGQLLRPFPQFIGGSFRGASWGNSNYHALQSRFEKRLSAGSSLMVSYTFSKIIAEADGRGFTGLESSPGNQRNFYCRACDRTVSAYDQRHRFVVSGTYDFPVGRGKRIGTNWSKWTQGVLGGWQLNGILTLSMGLPLRLSVPSNTSYSFGGNQKPDSTGMSAELGDKKTIDRWFDTTQFLLPKPFTFGNVSRVHPTLRSDAAQNVDLSLFKIFRVKEGTRVEFRGDAFNLANHPQFNYPGLTVTSASFGVVSGVMNTPRQMQLALKIVF